MTGKVAENENPIAGSAVPEQGCGLSVEKRPYSGGKDGSDFTRETIVFWARRSEGLLSRQEAQEAAANVCGFFEVLAEWKRKASEEGEREEHGEELWVS